MRRIAFVWANFGPMHIDRLEGMASFLKDRAEIVGIELFASAGDSYGWSNDYSTNIRRITLFDGTGDPPPLGAKLAAKLWRACYTAHIDTVFLCGHGLKGIFASSIFLRLTGIKVFIASDSKFDDRPRAVWKEALKAIYYWPYNGALVAGPASQEYFRFLGLKRRPVAHYYDNISLSRVLSAAGALPAPEGASFVARDFLCVARLVEKKNHRTLLEAYARYVARYGPRRRLILCGAGPLEEAIRAQAEKLGVAEHVVFTGWEQSDAVARRYADALCLILPSIEEQFGIVVLEAQAMGLPVIVSDVTGARYGHVSSGVNGFVVESSNAEGLAFFMELLASDEALWAAMAERARSGASLGDVRHFVTSVCKLARI
jgi:glycosyltransferase involved in cell wall biosynthesis